MSRECCDSTSHLVHQYIITISLNDNRPIILRTAKVPRPPVKIGTWRPGIVILGILGLIDVRGLSKQRE